MAVMRNVIAVIDDNLSVLSAVGRLLSALGYDPQLYASAKEFLDVALVSEARCVILDVQIGNDSGIDLATHLTKQGFTIPIIFMSGNPHEAMKNAAAAIGGIAFLDKPFTAERLVEALAKIPIAASGEDRGK
jgi:FixJ family two-component response regulator